MGKTLWGILAVILGFVTFFVVLMIGFYVSYLIFPLGVGFDQHDAEAVRAPRIGELEEFFVVWGSAAFAGAWVAAWLAPGGKLAFGLSIGVLGLLAVVRLFVMIPAPRWMWVVAVAYILLAAYLGAKLAMRNARRTAVGI